MSKSLFVKMFRDLLAVLFGRSSHPNPGLMKRAERVRQMYCGRTRKSGTIIAKMSSSAVVTALVCSRGQGVIAAAHG